MDKATAIVVAAGKGRRFKSKEKKPFVKLGKRPLLAYALAALEKSPLINDIILVVDSPLIKKAAGLVKRYRINKVRNIVKGGRDRSQSVKNGLARVGKDARIVLIHDGVRPFIEECLVKKVVSAANRFGAAILAHPVKPTIKVSNDGLFVNHTPARRHLWEAETPQVFRREIIERACEKALRGKHYTDDAALVEGGGAKVRIVKGDYRNIKVTTVEDLKIAEAFIKKR